LGHEFALLGSRDVIGNVTILFIIGHFIPFTVSEIFNGKCDAKIDMNLNDL